MAHRDRDNNIILDALYERKAPFNPSDAVADIVKLAREYRCGRIVSDAYAGAWVSESFNKHGVLHILSDRDKSKAYLDCLPLFTSGRARLLDNGALINQFVNLERRVLTTGRERVDHPPNFHDDAANAVALAMTIAAQQVRQETPIVMPYVVSGAARPDWTRAGPNPFAPSGAIADYYEDKRSHGFTIKS